MQQDVILYYKFVQIDNPGVVRDWQYSLCEKLNLKGRIIIAEEGINGTLGGHIDDIRSYKETMNNHYLFDGIDFKHSEGSRDVFPRLSVKVRDEIVTLGAGDVDHAKTAQYLNPDEFHEFVQRDDVVVMDARNNYESKIGRFKGAITPDADNFRDFPEILEQYEDLKDKKVVTYCTGGIRCEKLTVLMKEKGFKDVYQLEGGIVRYGEKYPDGHWEGSCFVFDDRMKVDFKSEVEEVGSCVHCEESTNDYYNCAYKPCNKLILMCDECVKNENTCSEECKRKLVEKV